MSTPTEKQYYSRYLRKTKSLEQRFRKFLQSEVKSPKRNLANDWQAALKYHQAFGNYPCILGHVEEYEDDWKNCPFSIFVHYGLIHMHPTSLLHEETNLRMNFAIYNGFSGAGLRRFLRFVGHSDIRLINTLGCHFVFNKQPDAQFWIRFLGQITSDPFLTLETSVYNETWQEMFIHAAAYLNEHTGIQYHLMIYFDMNQAQFNMTIVLLQRTTPPRFYPTKNARDQALQEEEDMRGFAEERTQTEAERIETRAERRRTYHAIRSNLPRPENCTYRQIEEIYGVRVLFRIEINETFFESQVNGAVAYIGPIHVFRLNTLSVFAETAIRTEEFPQEINVQLDAEFFENLRIDFYRLRQ